MSKSYARCQYISDNKMQCESWFPTEPENYKFCPVHAHLSNNAIFAIGPKNGTLYVGDEFLDITEAARKEVAEMSVEEIDARIAKHEEIIARERIKILAKRAVRSGKIQDLSDEQRAELRKHKVEKAVKDSVPKTSQTMKSDPIGYLVNKHGMTREAAIKLLQMD